MHPRYVLRFIDEPAQSVAKKLEKGGSWYFTLHPAYESSLVVGFALDTLKELENLNDARSNGGDSLEEDVAFSKILLKFGLAGIEIKYMFTEIDDRLEEIKEIPSNKILYSVVGDKFALRMEKLRKDKKSKKAAKRGKNNGRHRRDEKWR